MLLKWRSIGQLHASCGKSFVDRGIHGAPQWVHQSHTTMDLGSGFLGLLFFSDSLFRRLIFTLLPLQGTKLCFMP